MRKKLSFLIALAISLSVSTTSFAAADTKVSDSTKVNTPAISVNESTLTLEQALSKLESSNEELKSIDNKLDGLNKQYDKDKQQVIFINSSDKSQSQYPNGQYVQVMLKKDVVPLQDEQNINDQKNIRDERLNNIKFDLQREYMNVITAKAQIDNINKNIANLDDQIKQTEAKINLGQVTKDTLNPLKVEKSQRLAQLAVPSAQMQQSLLSVKKYLNIDLSKDLKLAPAKKEFVKFDDKDIESKINSTLQNDYTLNSIQKNIDIAKMQLDIYTKYSYDSVTGQLNSELNLKDLQNKLADTNTNQQVYLWKAYYNLKNKEDVVQTQLLSQQSAQMSYDKAKQSFDNGMIDKVALAAAELTFNNQKASTEQAVNDYMVTQEQFKYILNGHNSLAASIK